MPASPSTSGAAAAARNSLKRVSAWTSATAVETDRPEVSR